MEDRHIEYWGMPLNTYCMLIHLSQLTSIVVPGLGLILPVVMWLIHKDDNALIDKHGRRVVNWIISLCAYSIVCGILTFIFIGYIGFFILGITNLIFVVIATLKAKDGELWSYPLNLKLIRE